MNFEMGCDKSFAIINMDEFQFKYWQSVIKDFAETKSSTRLVGVQALLWGKDVVGISFHDDDVGMVRREIYLVEDGEFTRDPIELNLLPLSTKIFRPVLFSSPGKILAVKEKDVIYSKFGLSMNRIEAIDFESPRFSMKLRTEILKNDYNLGNLILRFPVELIDQRIFEYESLMHIFERARYCVRINTPRIQRKEVAKEFTYDAEIGEWLQ
jgi:hypothetical protein